LIIKDVLDVVLKIVQLIINLYLNIRWYNNKAVMQEELLSHYQKYKTYFQSYNAKKITCDCGSIIRYDRKSKHLKTNKHQLYINTS
jgi:hypothetical protein